MPAAGRLRILQAGYSHRTTSIRLRADMVRKQADIGGCSVEEMSAAAGAFSRFKVFKVLKVVRVIKDNKSPFTERGI